MLGSAARLALLAALVLSLVVPAAQAQATPAPTPTVVVTGANRGLGLEFARQYAARGWNVVATARRPEEARELTALAAQSRGRIDVQAVDVTDVASVDAFAKRLAGRPVDVLINNAGNYGDPRQAQLGSIDFSQFDAFFHVNTLGPLKVTEALLPNLRAGSQKKVAVLNSLAGSFAFAPMLEKSGQRGHYFYRASKAAAGMFMVTLAGDLRGEGFTVISLSPGQVDTRNAGLKAMGIPGIIDIDKSVGGMIAVLDKATAEQSGRYFRWDGSEAQY